MRIEHWINNELITIDTEDVWAETFAHWDCLVATDTASDIATAVVNVLIDAEAERDASAHATERILGA